MKLSLILLRISILIIAVIAFAYSSLPIAIKGICIAMVLCGYLSYE